MKQTQPDEGACIFGAGVLLKHLESLSEKTVGVQGGSEDIEYIHDARVASRRLRANIPLFKDCLPKKKSKKWLKGIKNVTRELGAARDLDVQLERVRSFLETLGDTKTRYGVKRLCLRLHQLRERMQQPLSDAMDALIRSGLLEAMRTTLEPLAKREDGVYLYTEALYQHSYASIHSRLVNFLGYEAYVSQPEKIHELHQMRIAAKWLRYTMETFAPLYSNQLKCYIQAVKKVQDLLGEVHDCDVWAELLPRFMEEERLRILDFYGSERTFELILPGILAFQESTQANRGDLYAEFYQAWQGWRAEDLWAGLEQSVRVPFQQEGRFYPPLAPSIENPADCNG